MLSYFLSIFLCYFFIFLSLYLCFLSLIYSQLSLYLSSPVFAPSFVNCYYHHLPVSSLSLSLYTHTNKGNNKENKHTHLNTHKQPHEKEKEKNEKIREKKIENFNYYTFSSAHASHSGNEYKFPSLTLYIYDLLL